MDMTLVEMADTSSDGDRLVRATLADGSLVPVERWTAEARSRVQAAAEVLLGCESSTVEVVNRGRWLLILPAR